MTRRIFRSLAQRNYRIWMMGVLFSNIGTWMQFTTQDWLVLTELTAYSGVAIGIVISLQLAPSLLFILWTGLVADQVEKQKFLILTQFSLGFLALILGGLVIGGHIKLWEVYLFALLSGCIGAFDSPVRQTFVGELVGEDDLSNAVALNSVLYNAGRMVGPALAGFCISEIGSGWSFILNGFSFFGVGISLLSINSQDLFKTNFARPRKGEALLSGISYVWKNEDLRIILLMLFIIGAFGLNLPIYISTMAVGTFHVGAHGFGLLNSFVAVGTILGGIIAANLERAGFETIMIGSTVFGVGCLCAAFSPGYWYFALALIFIGMSSLTFTAVTNSFMQLSSDASIRGRVLAIRFAVFSGATPIGAPIVGWIASYFGPRWSLGVGAISGLVVAGIAGVYWLHKKHVHEKNIL